MQAIAGGNVDGSFAGRVLLIGDSSVVHQEHSGCLVGGEAGLVEEGVPRAGIRGVRVGSPLDEPGGEGVLVVAHVVRGEVAGVQLL